MYDWSTTKNPVAVAGKRATVVRIPTERHHEEIGSPSSVGSSSPPSGSGRGGGGGGGGGVVVIVLYVVVKSGAHGCAELRLVEEEDGLRGRGRRGRGRGGGGGGGGSCVFGISKNSHNIFDEHHS